MTAGEKRVYRSTVRPTGLTTFGVAVKETDLLISAGSDLTEAAREAVLNERRFIEERIRAQPEFLESLKPLPLDKFAPAVIREMLRAGREAGVGPMAAVAGAVAGRVAEVLLKISEEVIVENGGDLALAAKRDLTIAVYAGASALSGKLAIKITAADQPVGVGTSSGTIGHSLSLGRADAATVVAETPALADALATALGNRVGSREEMAPALEWLSRRAGALGGLVVLGSKMAAWGRVELVRL